MALPSDGGTTTPIDISEESTLLNNSGVPGRLPYRLSGLQKR
jgi:hypothetical protein